MSAFLASVRNIYEAKIAYSVGADWIDLKEPSSGALGAVAPQIITEVVQWVRDQERQVYTSATIGDCWEAPRLMPKRVERLHTAGIDYAKIGIFAASPSLKLLQIISKCCSVGPKIILVCFAEKPPDLHDMNAYAATGIVGAMLDTAEKTGPSLTGLLSNQALDEFVATAHRLKLLCGLAGSLRLGDIDSLSHLGADYLGFRGALCSNAKRESHFSFSAATQVRERINLSAKPGIDRRPDQLLSLTRDARSN